MNKKLQAALSAAGMSQAELARRLGIHPSHVSRWLRRKLLPTAPQVASAVEVLGVESPADLGYSVVPSFAVLDYA